MFQVGDRVIRKTDCLVGWPEDWLNCPVKIVKISAKGSRIWFNEPGDLDGDLEREKGWLSDKFVKNSLERFA